MTRLDDLTPKARARVAAAIARDQVARATRPTVAGDTTPAARGSRTGGRWTCHICGPHKIFTSWSAVERHVDETHGAGRIDVVLEVER